MRTVILLLTISLFGSSETTLPTGIVTLDDGRFVGCLVQVRQSGLSQMTEFILLTATILLILLAFPRLFKRKKSKTTNPRILYKYIHSDAIKYYLKDFTVSFTNYQYLNDPLETSIQNTLDYTRKEIRYPQWNPESLSFWGHFAMTKSGLTYADRHEDKLNEYNSIKSINADLNRKIEALEKCRKNMGILSLTTDQYNPVMWAHYANNHKGICIGFDMTHPFFNSTDSLDGFFHKSSRIFSLLKIDYKSHRPSYTDLSLEDYVASAFSTKRVEWSYEREYRLLRPIAPNDNVRRVEKYPVEALREIYLGIQCEIDKNLLKDIGNSTKVYKLFPVKDSYELSATELNLK